MKKLTKKIIAMALVFICMMTFVFSTPGTKSQVYAAGKGSWQQDDKGITYIKENGNSPKSTFKTIGKYDFYFDSEGYIKTGWIKVKGEKYYCSKKGKPGKKGRLLKGWQSVSGKDCYFDYETGAYDADKEAIMVAIDAGHQSKANSATEPIGPGASTKKAKVAGGTSGKYSGLAEYQLNLIVAKKLESELLSRGYQVYMIRTKNDVNISNSERAKAAADAGADILVRIHADGSTSSSANGATVCQPTTSNPYLTSANIKASRKLSECLIKAYCKSTGANNRGCQSRDDLSGINWSTIPVSLIELGFMTNKTEDLNMASEDYQEKMATGMADGIDQYFNK